MSKVICFGEALIDFLNIDKQQSDRLSLNGFRQYPGGAPANAAVAVAKLGGEAWFAGQVGEDMFGDFLAEALQAYGVNTRYLSRHPVAKTALAFVELDEHGDRRFSFYRQDSADLLLEYEQVEEGWFAGASIFHFCSNTLTTLSMASVTRHALDMARAANCLVSFDVNLRHNLWAGGQVKREVVNELVAEADILKFSTEELIYLAGGNVQGYMDKLMAGRCCLLVVTDGGGSIHYRSKTCAGDYQPPKVKVADTTAGGDGFIGGLLYVLSRAPKASELLNTPSQLLGLIQFAACCGALAVTRPGAFPALPELAEVQNMARELALSESHIFFN